MINNTDYQESYTTVADQTTWYPISFVYYDDPNTGLPELIVNLDGNELTYPTDYILGSQGLQLTTAPAAGLSLTIFRNPIFEQLIDFQTGIIDPEQIESGFDRSVMRDLYLYGWVDWLTQKTQDTFDQLSDVAWSGSYNDLIDQPTISNSKITIVQDGITKGYFTLNQGSDATINIGGGSGGSVSWSDITGKPNFATVATSGSYDDLLNKPTIPDTTNMQVTTNLVTSVSAASTDLQYPSAKLFYDTCGDIETLINAL